jgi:DNA gyrase subunit B
LPIFHLSVGTDSSWFTTREALTEYLNAHNLAIDSRGDERGKAPTDGNGQLPSNGAEREPTEVHVHLDELHEVKTINAGLKELEKHGFGMQDLIPQERTGSTEAKFHLHREETQKGIEDLRALLSAVREAGEKGLQVTRFKGLGEMNPEELRETTLDKANRTLVKVSLQDAASADEMFRVLMGDKVEPRRAFIEKHALDVRNLDV